MEGRTFTPASKRAKSKRGLSKVKHIPLHSAVASDLQRADSDDKDNGWSVVTRKTTAAVRHRRESSALNIQALSLNSPGDDDTTLEQIRDSLDPARRALVREPLLQRLAGLSLVKSPDGSSKLQDLEEPHKAITEISLLEDAYATARRETAPKKPDESLAQLRTRRLKRVRPAWLASNARKTLLDTLGNVLNQADADCDGLWTCVCLGLGSLSTEATGWKGVSMWQLVIWEDVCEQLFSERSIIFQEPVFNDIDEAFLRELGHDVKPSPLGYDATSSDKCIVFAPHFPPRFWPRGIRTGRPLVVLGNPIGDTAQLLAKIPARDVVCEAMNILSGPEAQLLRSEVDAKKEMQAFLSSWTNLRITAPEECRESLLETVIWTRQPQSSDDDDDNDT